MILFDNYDHIRVVKNNILYYIDIFTKNNKTECTCMCRSIYKNSIKHIIIPEYITVDDEQIKVNEIYLDFFHMKYDLLKEIETIQINQSLLNNKKYILTEDILLKYSDGYDNYSIEWIKPNINKLNIPVPFYKLYISLYKNYRKSDDYKPEYNLIKERLDNLNYIIDSEGVEIVKNG